MWVMWEYCVPPLQVFCQSGTVLIEMKRASGEKAGGNAEAGAAVATGLPE